MKDDAKNRRWCRACTALFMGLLLLFYPLWFALRGALDTENRENRPLATGEDLRNATLQTFPATFESLLADHAPFRNQLMTLNAGINLGLFGTVQSDAVLLGREGWLFLNNNEDSASLDDYQGLLRFNEQEMEEIACNLSALQQALAARGTRLVLLIPPSKELVYSRYMPADIPVLNPDTRADVLAGYLRAHTDVPVLWPKEQLCALAESQQIYFKYDTHWNPAGAAYTSALLLQAAGVEGPAPQALCYEPSPAAPEMDLANLAALWALLPPDANWQPAGWMPGVEVQRTYTDETGDHQRFASTHGGGQKLLMFRDSFGLAMQQPLAACFTESAFVHTNAFNENTFAAEQPDIFVLQVTQRYLEVLQTKLPQLVQWAQQM